MAEVDDVELPPAADAGVEEVDELVLSVEVLEVDPAVVELAVDDGAAVLVAELDFALVALSDSSWETVPEPSPRIPAAELRPANPEYVCM